MKKKLILAAVVALLLIGGMGCVSETATLKDISLTFVFTNEEDGTSILDQDPEIKVYYNIKGKKVEPIEVLYENLDNRKGFSIISPENDDAYIQETHISVMMNTFDIRNNQSITYIQINDYPLDTILCEHIRKRGYHVISKAWYNNELVWDRKATGINNWVIKIIK